MADSSVSMSVDSTLGKRGADDIEDPSLNAPSTPSKPSRKGKEPASGAESGNDILTPEMRVASARIARLKDTLVLHDKYREQQLVKAPCGHFFVDFAICAWVKKQGTCPHCREPLRRTDLQPCKVLPQVVEHAKRLYGCFTSQQRSDHFEGGAAGSGRVIPEHEQSPAKINSGAAFSAYGNATKPASNALFQTTCCVCSMRTNASNNALLKCAQCKVAVHQACYGIQVVPTDGWTCSSCSLGEKTLELECKLCPNTGGIYQRTRKAEWVHVTCALWTPELGFEGIESMRPVNALTNVLAGRYSLLCSLCKVRKGGCIQCIYKKCKVAFHVTCAQAQGLLVEGNDPSLAFVALCGKHIIDPAKYIDPRVRSNKKQKKKEKESAGGAAGAGGE